MISTLVRPKTLRIAGLAVGAVALAGSAVYVTASAAGYSLNLGGPSSNVPAAAPLAATPQDAAGTSAACTDFMTHFAAALGTDQSKVDAAFQQALAQTLADQVKAGKLTQAQADAITKRLAGKEPCALGSGAGKANAAFTKELLAAAASALGITPDELKADFAKGMSLSQIAAAQNPPITEDQFRTKLIATLQPMLDKAVADGKLTSAQEQQIIKRLQSGPLPFWVRAPKAPSTSSSPPA